jgi:hypothetical protein
MMIERIKGILTTPKQTWNTIQSESHTFGQVFTHYAVPLAVIPAFFGMLGYIFVGIKSGFGVSVYRIPLTTAFVWAVTYYILTLIGLFLDGVIINAFARVYDSEQCAVKAYKVAVYSFTPAFLAGVLNIIPTAGFLVFLISLTGIYLLYHGLPVMMQAPREKLTNYVISVTVGVIVLHIILSGIASLIISLS